MTAFKVTLFFLLLLFFVPDIQAQSENDREFRKIELNLNVNVLNVTNIPLDGSLKSVQFLATIYPIKYRTIQFGLSVGFENVQSPRNDSVMVKENRIPILASTRINLGPNQVGYVKAQLGTGITTKSRLVPDEGEEIKIFRENIGAPVIANIGLGLNLPFGKIGVGVELGYSYKQLAYKLENRYGTGAFYLGLTAIFP